MALKFNGEWTDLHTCPKEYLRLTIKSLIFEVGASANVIGCRPRSMLAPDDASAQVTNPDRFIQPMIANIFAKVCC